jgi:RND family efflux transporter MFP subunit
MKIFRFIIPVVIIGLSGWKAKQLIDSKPEAGRWSTPAATTHVMATAVFPTNYQVIVQSQGTVKARTESTLIPEVAGIVVRVSPNFRDGGFFEADELLLEIDRSDYDTALTVALASHIEAQSTLDQEKALAEQALDDWKRLGGNANASPLTLRKPQLAKAEAVVASAAARIKEAERNLKRTQIQAPYAGRILTKRVDLGQYVSPGTVMANIYAVDYAEIRLPLSNRQLTYLSVPESFRGDSSEPIAEGPAVTLRSEIGGRNIEWQGKVVRAEGAVDTRSRQHFVIAQVDNPYGRRGSDQPPLKVGMFVEAEIVGKRLQDVFVIPRSALRPNDEILVVDMDNKLHRQQVAIDWRDDDNVVASKGLQPGTALCLTSLPFAAENALVVPDIDGEGPRFLEGQQPQRGDPGDRKGKGRGGSKGGPGSKDKGEPSSKKGDWKAKKGGS